MGQEFVIKSQILEQKINQLLPSQGGAQAGVDLSASTMVVPIVDLTESAEGSSLRADLQTATAFGDTVTLVENTATTIISTTGFYKVDYTINGAASSGGNILLQISDGSATNTIKQIQFESTTINTVVDSLVVFLPAGHSFIVNSSANNLKAFVSSSQIADLNGNLTNPLGFTFTA